MQLVGSRGQEIRDLVYDASGSIASGGTSQLVLPERKSTSYLFVQNISDTDLYLEIGTARATARLTDGAVTSVTVTNGGFGFTYAPIVEFLGGGTTGWNMNDAGFVGCGQPQYPAPSNVARAHCVLTNGVVTSIVVDNGGSGYAVAPYVALRNSHRDPNGAADPFFGSAPSGVYLPGNTAFNFHENGTFCMTDPISVYGATTGKKFTVKWAG